MLAAVQCWGACSPSRAAAAWLALQQNGMMGERIRAYDGVYGTALVTRIKKIF